jgi:hypothetical protein
MCHICIHYSCKRSFPLNKGIVNVHTTYLQNIKDKNVINIYVYTKGWFRVKCEFLGNIKN